MKNIKILKNISSSVLYEFQNLYDLKYRGKRPQDRWTPNLAASLINKEDIEYLSQFLPIQPNSIELFYISNGMVKPHIDRGRKTALQIPVEFDCKKSFVYAAKHSDLSFLTPVRGSFTSRKISKVTAPINNPPNWFYKWDDDLFDKYNLEFPVLQNVTLPHGGVNYSEIDEVFFTISYKPDYDEVCKKFLSWT